MEIKGAEISSLPISNQVIFHLDMNAYFASVEQACNPFIRNKPVAVVSSMNYSGAAILARSYEAKQKGVKTFSKLRDAQIICPNIIPVPLDHLKYYDVNNQINKILERYTPLIEIYSIDEFFLDLTQYFKLHQKTYTQLAKEIKLAIATELSPILTCSIGVGNNKLLAKVGSDYLKPDGLTIIPWEERFKYLDSMELADIWGIGRNCLPKLAALGIKSTAQLRDLSDQQLRNLVGSYGTRLKMIARGEHYDKVDYDRNRKPQKTMQHAHTLSQATKDIVEIKTLMHKLAEKLATRLRKHHQETNLVSLGIRPSKEQNYGWGYLPRLKGTISIKSTSNGIEIYNAALKILEQLDLREVEVRLLVVGLNCLNTAIQFKLDHTINRRDEVDLALDIVNNKYGEFTLRTADILNQRAKEQELSIVRQPMTFHP